MEYKKLKNEIIIRTRKTNQNALCYYGYSQLSYDDDLNIYYIKAKHIC